MPTRTCATAAAFAVFLAAWPFTARSQTQWTKSPTGPVLSPGAPGSWEEAVAVATTVIFHDGVYKMWYEGDRGFGYATSLDGVTWSKFSPDSVLGPGSPGTWDEQAVNSASVVVTGNTYQMWYSGVDAGGENRIGRATSPDGVNWTKDPANPVLDLGPPGSWDESEVIHPYVMYKDGMYHMWYNGHDGVTQRILYAWSPDGVEWTRFTPYPALEPGPPGSWDETELGPMCVLFDGHLFHMWYTAWNQAGEFRIGYARSPDGLTWSKDTAGNPVLSPGPPGVWDDVLVALPVVRLEATDYVMWYAGTEGTRFQTGRAVSHDAPSGIGGGPAAYGLRLEHNHPNPFNPQTTISYELLRPETVSIRIYDIAGRLVRNLVDGEAASAGRHDVSWDGRDESGQGVASGVYYYRLEVGSLSRTARMTLVK